MKNMRRFFYIVLAFMLVLPFTVKAEDQVVWNDISYVTLTCPGTTIEEGDTLTCAITVDAEYAEDVPISSVSFTVNDGDPLTITQDGATVTFSIPDDTELTETKEVNVYGHVTSVPDAGSYFTLSLTPEGETPGGEGGDITPDPSGDEETPSGEGDETVIPSEEEESESATAKGKNPETADMNVVQLSVLGVLFTAISVLSFKKVVRKF